MAKMAKTHSLPATTDFFPHITHVEKRAVLLTFRETANLTRSCAASGVHHSQHYYWLKTDQTYAAAFDDMKQLAAVGLEEEAMRRAREGVKRTIYHQGAPVGEELVYSDTLLIFLLKGWMPEKYRETSRRDDRSDVSELLKAVLLELADRSHARDVTPEAEWAPLPPGTRPGLPAPPDADEEPT